MKKKTIAKSVNTKPFKKFSNWSFLSVCFHNFAWSGENMVKIVSLL